MDIKKTVHNLEKKWGTKNPYALCKYLKITIMYKDLGQIKGYYKKYLRKKYIVINENLDPLSRKMVLAHELGHALLHNDDVFLMKSCFLYHKNSVYENEANVFAKEILANELDGSCHLEEEYI